MENLESNIIRVKSKLHEEIQLELNPFNNTEIQRVKYLYDIELLSTVLFWYGLKMAWNEVSLEFSVHSISNLKSHISILKLETAYICPSIF